MAIALQLAKSGWWGGDPERILKARVDLVIGACQYVEFVNVFERTVVEINREKL